MAGPKPIRTENLAFILDWRNGVCFFRFRNMMSYKKKSGVYMVDFSNLNAVDQDDTPRVSQRCTDDKRRFEAKQSADLRRKISSNSCYLKVR